MDKALKLLSAKGGHLIFQNKIVTSVHYVNFEATNHQDWVMLGIKNHFVF